MIFYTYTSTLCKKSLNCHPATSLVLYHDIFTGYEGYPNDISL